jgi:hypothetical protein
VGFKKCLRGRGAAYEETSIVLLRHIQPLYTSCFSSSDPVSLTVLHNPQEPFLLNEIDESGRDTWISYERRLNGVHRGSAGNAVNIPQQVETRECSSPNGSITFLDFVRSSTDAARLSSCCPPAVAAALCLRSCIRHTQLPAPVESKWMGNSADGGQGGKYRRPNRRNSVYSQWRICRFWLRHAAGYVPCVWTCMGTTRFKSMQVAT